MAGVDGSKFGPSQSHADRQQQQLHGDSFDVEPFVLQTEKQQRMRPSAMLHHEQIRVVAVVVISGAVIRLYQKLTD